MSGKSGQHIEPFSSRTHREEIRDRHGIGRRFGVSSDYARGVISLQRTCELQQLSDIVHCSILSIRAILILAHSAASNLISIGRCGFNRRTEVFRVKRRTAVAADDRGCGIKYTFHVTTAATRFQAREQHFKLKLEREIGIFCFPLP